MNLLKKTWMILLAIGVCSCQAKVLDVTSPNGKIKVSLVKVNKGKYSDYSFSIGYTDKQILSKSSLGLETNLQKFTDNLVLKSVSKKKQINEGYVMITGKRSHCSNKGVEKCFSFENENGQQLDVTFRVYNDGVAIKYGLNAVAEDEYVINEYTSYSIPEKSKRWIQQYDTSYERFFPLSTDGRLAGQADVNTWGYPALIEPKDSIFMLITEANIRRGHCGSLLYNGDDCNSYCVRLADKEPVGNGHWESPWRTLIIGKLSDVVESTLVTDVSDPAKIDDTAWIKPGSASWLYWANNHGTKDYQIVKEYIDLAEQMEWPYNLIDWEWDEMSNGGNLQDALNYAHNKGVTPLLWYNSSTGWIGPGPLFRLNKKEDREKEYGWLKQMGVAGIKVDFFTGDSVSTMNYYMDLLEDGLKYKLMINLHGASVPRGWQRTYPNMMSVEGVYGAEWYNNNGDLTERAAEHNATLPFTRNVVGPMDYTPGTFSDSQYPHKTTYAHELALPVIFESSIQHMPDRPSVYRDLPEAVKSLLSALPTSWDDTKLLAGYPGVEVVIARRKGDTWYVAGINGTKQKRTLHVNLRELQLGSDTAVIFKDGPEDRSFSINEHFVLPQGQDYIDIACRPQGGFVVVFK